MDLASAEATQRSWPARRARMALDQDAGLQAVPIPERTAQGGDTSAVMVTHGNRILDLADRIVTVPVGRVVTDTSADSGVPGGAQRRAG